MGLTLATASPLDFAEVLADAGGRVGRLSRRQLARGAAQIAGSTAVTIRDDAGRLCLIAGLDAMEGDGSAAQLWLMAGAGLAPNLLPGLRLGDQALRDVAGAAAPLGVFAFVQSVAGARLAASFKFEELGVIDGDDGRPLAVWRRVF